MSAKFIIFALPRSRTKWTSEWLSFGGRYSVGHDLTVDCSSIQDFEDALDSVDGTVETGAVLGWRLLLDRRPDLRVATISRPVNEVIFSLRSKGVPVDEIDMLLRAEMLAALRLQVGIENFTFDGLRAEVECARMWEFLLRRDFDFEWWMEMREKNIQIDLVARVERLRANAYGLAALRAEIVQASAGLTWLN